MPAAIGQSLESDRLSWPIEFVAPDLSDRSRPDGRSRGGASRRGSCALSNAQPPLTALVPSTLMQQPTSQNFIAENAPGAEEEISTTPAEVVLSLTTHTHPTFWFYVPYRLDGSMALEFVLQDAEGNTLYQIQLTPEANDSGILGVSLPDSSPALATATPYRWFLIAYCDAASPVFVEGWMERVELTAATLEQLEQATLAQKATIYANQGIWQDALMILGSLYLDNPKSNAIAADWSTLLESAGLEILIRERFLPIFDIEHIDSFSS